jgi:plasmid stability protein
MANLTIVVDDALLKRARVRAAELGTSVNAVLRDHLAQWVVADESQARAVASLLERSRRSRSGRGGRTWTREELHDR